MSEVTKAQAFEWLRNLATSDNAPPEAGVALEAWHEAASAAQNMPTTTVRHVPRETCSECGATWPGYLGALQTHKPGCSLIPF